MESSTNHIATRNTTGLPEPSSAVCQIDAPYLIHIGDETRADYAKTAFGLRDWAREKCLGQYRTTSNAVSIDLPDLTFSEAVKRGAKSLILGCALEGGKMQEAWHGDIIRALESGLNIVSGMHVRLEDYPEIAVAARNYGKSLVNVRHSQSSIQIATGIKRSGRRLLTVGTDCALGKKYTALAVTGEMRERGIKATFRATGQTGIMIAGSGISHRLNRLGFCRRRRRNVDASQLPRSLGCNRGARLSISPGLCRCKSWFIAWISSGRADHVS